jgi:CRP/FNR family transcriptional regulator, cyclic AMP receptor protein
MQRTYRLTLQGAINVPEAARTRLTEIGKRRCFADGQHLMHQGDAANGFFYLAGGQVMVGRSAMNGVLTIFGVAGTGDIIGDLAYFAEVPRTTDTIADGPVEAIWIDGAVFRKHVLTAPGLAMLMLKSLASQLLVTVERVDAERTMSLPDRLAHALLSMECATGESIACTHQQLGDLIGVSRVSLGVALRQLEKNGAIAGSYGKVRIVDRAMLEARLALIGRPPGAPRTSA